LIIGNKDEFGNDLVPSEGELSPSQIALIIAKRIKGLSLNIELESKVEEIETLLANINSAPVSDLFRLPSFCAGCPHNTSTKVPDDSFAFGGIGCHGMATFMPERKTYNLGQMGGEGVMWTGIAPFTETNHIFQNLGDGTYYHSGILALRAAIASKANITFKILVNDAIAMTGGQEISGKVQVDNLSWQVHSEGAKKVVVMTDYPEKYPANSSFAPGVKIYQRDELDKVQRELREIKGVTVILYDQYCATELRRRRKRGLAEEPNKRIFINPLVCEGCGDCGVQSNCIAIEPHESKFGRKREINQSACNKDYSCTKGYCPSFLTVTGGTLKKKGNKHKQNENPKYQNEDLPTPVVCDLNKPFNILLTGIGGSGVITLGAIIGTAAHLENKGASTLDVAGLAQRNGPVTSHLRVANSPSDLHSTRIASGSADLIIGCDIVVTTGIESISKINRNHTNMVINSHVAPTSNFASNPDLDLSSARMIKGLKEIASPELMHIVNATKFATSLMGNSIAANLFLVGYAIQKGLFPISLSAIERAIELNGVSIDMNKESIYWGRLAALDIKKLETITSADNKSIDYSESLSSIIDDRYNFLISYQNIKYAEKYKALIHKIIKIDDSVPNNRDDLSIAAAKFYFKLMAYKDEYEVARLHTGDDIKKYLDDKLEGDYKIEYSLAPPVFGGRDKISGRYPKRKLPSFTYYLFAIMKHFKFLRGTSFDVFGMSTHRKIERGLISEYESMFTEIESNINIENYDAAVKIALLPDHIKGYDVVKESNIEKSKLLKEQYFNEFYGKNIEVVNKYPKAVGG
jgi:indolepyruvate ferredoxin oxidoreductase